MPSTRYSALHERIRKARGPAREQICVGCGGQASTWAYDGTDPDELTDIDHGREVTYSADESRYVPMCYRCHKSHDDKRRPRKACKQGHPFTEENTLIVSGVKRCRTCNRERCKAYYHRNDDIGSM